MPKALATILPSAMVSNDDLPASPPSAEELCCQIRTKIEALISTATSSKVRTFKDFEEQLRIPIFDLARLLITLFLCIWEERERARMGSQIRANGRACDVRPAQSRKLNTLFGVVRYWRTYLRAAEQDQDRAGFYPLDVKLGLTADRLSMSLMSLMARLATKLSYGQTQAVLRWFMRDVPSTEVIEKTVLGLGSKTEAWFEQAPPPEGDGDVLVVLFDSKGVPTATDTELQRRRGKRKKRSQPQSKRHRGRGKRSRYGSKPRRKKGDKSKNAKMATMVVMYTLKRSGKKLLGPINPWHYASFGPKRHAFEIAIREAKKRGFGPDSGKTIQVVMDGDGDLDVYVNEYFPDAIQTLDIYHVIEYLWKAGKCIFREGSQELKKWVERQKSRLYGGHIKAVLRELRHRRAEVPLRGPGTKSKRERLDQVIGYINKRQHKMNYAELLRKDLEIGSGAVEGAIKHIIGFRFDRGGMRWIHERAQALLQLRCIEVNDDWESFINWVHDDVRRRTKHSNHRIRIQRNSPVSLPKLKEAA